MTAAVVPEQGQLVQVRHRNYIVQDVDARVVEPSAAPWHRVRLEAVDDDQLGDVMDVIWEHEVHRVVHEGVGLPRPEAWDPLGRFEAFLLATRWSLSSVLDGLPLQAPFRGAIQIEDYQLDPVVRALRMPRVSLLIADDVGLGKTIEAGMVVQEMLARQRVQRMLILCPASLQRQWADEMEQKFALRFEVVDRDYVQRLRREYGVHVNPWASYPRLIASFDFLKREVPLREFRASLSGGARSRGLKEWDLLVIDEAHNVAPAGRQNYVRDSDRTRMVRDILPHFEHRLFLTATPHNGYTESFTALLEMLEPLRFSRGPTVHKEHLSAVMVRRLKDDMVDALGNERFPKREVEPLTVRLEGGEKALFDTLDRYTTLVLERLEGGAKLPVQFALTLLKKRLLSSPAAFAHSIDVHHSHTAVGDPEGGDDDASSQARVVRAVQQKLSEDFADDDEKDRTEETALAETGAFFKLTDEERRLVEEMKDTAGALDGGSDAKARKLCDWIEAHLRTDGAWNDERLIVFTEYKHTLDYLVAQFAACGWAERVTELYGGMPQKDREIIKRRFSAPTSEEPLRILVATDAASEGLNLQRRCRYLVHYEVPWNPNKMEQRNGRIDRHGQRRKPLCYHFAFAGLEDQQFLDVVVDKVRRQRADLGSVGDVIAAQVERALRGEIKHIDDPEERRAKMRREVHADVVTRDRIRELQRAVDDARSGWRLSPEHLRLVLDEALHLIGHPGLKPVEDGPLASQAWHLRNLPPAWAECRASLQDAKGRLLKLVFLPELARDREDCAIVHLDHPVVKRALGVFRRNLWSAGLHESHQMQRASYRVLPDRELSKPVLLLASRLVAISDAGVKLHEELLLTGGEIRQAELLFDDAERLGRLLDLEGEHPSIPSGVAGRLRQFFPHHEQALRRQLEEQIAARATTVGEGLAELGEKEATQVRALIDERIKEIRRSVRDGEKTVARLEGRAVEQGTFDFYTKMDSDELEQYRRDLSWLHDRLGRLAVEKESEPAAVKARYVLRGTPRCFPVGLLYLLPESLLRAAPSAEGGA